MSECCKKYEVITMNKLKGWPFEPMDKDVEPLGSGTGGDPLPMPG